MRKILIAFTWSMILAALAGVFVGLVLAEFGFKWWVGPGLTVGVTIFHAWLQSRQLLLSALGERKRPGVMVSGRGIPVTAGGMAARFESALSGGPALELEIERELTVITPTGVVISSDQVKHFITRTLARQLQGKPGLSRKYWTRDHRPPWNREEYESIVEVLTAYGFIQGRVPGKSGLLAEDYKRIINTIKRGE